MDMQDIRKLFELADKYQVAEVEFNNDEVSLRITRAHPVEGGVMMQAPMMSAAPAAATTATLPSATATPAAPAADTLPAGTQVKSPMVGSFYAAPAPGAKNFVEVGQNVKVGDTLCIIEAMKIMNPIKSEVSGKVVSILVENADPVEYGQPLFVIG
ncbi:MAG: acetyl-CoA carboxylase biotin carboxyl carrier protein [Gammaproteobacteria bacterium]|nr:acetyl-CoA carboxylase biotin carboxyl carrier protein [Gammaproteobacteria bacterium]OYZ08141.1 MAG: acetyl-CoA carboxylase, biotin carboxyl carrier protein [Thiotrichales bacterium 16-46-22]OZA19172.1 MAG: acetyl-CoA carboxylase, biotin carboxyl carrier protein [Thiotrichales bacterium 17-46-47]OZA96621.1 MAG: acetyl-CoA carboxylase, biotin carboxyl carrier protein [Thiotrichales bacterium 34-46-19]OZB87337.1 MAG: acetyl-CoA carboxylase, biotin carboxyl carrier protein [Thiotrichales bacte